MINVMKMRLSFCLAFLGILLTACGHAIVRDLSSDPALRIVIDPRIPVEHYTMIVRALSEKGQGKFEIIDRRDGFSALLQEQDLQFRSGYSDRFADREKFAQIGRALGAGAIVTAHASCYQKKTWLGRFDRYCKQTLAFVNASTGVVAFVVSGENHEEWTADFTVPDWDETVEKAIAAYPKYFEARKISPMLEQYMDQSEELSKRERAKQEEQRKPANYYEKTATQVQPDLQMMRQRANEMQKADAQQGEE